MVPSPRMAAPENGLDVFVEAAEFLNDSFVVADDEVDEKAALPWLVSRS